MNKLNEIEPSKYSSKMHEKVIKKYNNELLKDKKPVLELITDDNTNVIFSEYKDFNPKPSIVKLPIPISLKTALQKRFSLEERSKCDYTYQNTIEKKDWEKNIFGFIFVYLTYDPNGQNIASKLGIRKLNKLTPKQIVSLPLEILARLTKYNEREEDKDKNDNEFDKKDTLELLKEGLKQRYNSDWEGNGVCRTFASMTLAIFEALKKCQSNDSLVNNIYCFYDSGDDYEPPFRQEEITPHAWNMFLSIEDDGKKAVKSIVDITWGGLDYNEEDMIYLDHIYFRSESLIKNLVEKQEGAQKNIFSILKYYSDFINTYLTDFIIHKDRAKGAVKRGIIEKEEDFFKDYDDNRVKFKYKNRSDFINSEEFKKLSEKSKLKLSDDIYERIRDFSQQRVYYLKHALEIVRKANYFKNIPKEFSILLGEINGQWANSFEINTLFKIYQENPNFSFEKILDDYIDAHIQFHSLPNNTYQIKSDFIFSDPDLQKIFYKKIKEKCKPEIFEKIKHLGLLRSKMRSICPENFSSFDPIKNDLDLEELKDLLDILPDYDTGMHFSNFKKNRTQENLQILFNHAKNKIPIKFEISNEEFQSNIKNMTDYQILKYYSDNTS